MDGVAGWRIGLAAKAAICLVLVVAAEIAVDGNGLGAVVGLFAVLWLALTMTVRRALIRVPAAQCATVAAAAFAVILTDDPSLLAWVLFWSALSLAALLPRRGFDDAFSWVTRLGLHALMGIVSPFRDVARMAIVRDRRTRRGGEPRTVATALALPFLGGTLFVALFASANPLIGRAFSQIVLPDTWTMIWRSLLAAMVGVSVWSSLRPSARATLLARDSERAVGPALDPDIATLMLSLVTFNAVFAVENVLDLVFLWSGAALPAGVTMADYAHRGAYSLIVTALLAALFVLVALRPDNPAAGNRTIRRLVALWIAQNLLLVTSSALRTLDYVDIYGMTILRLSALAWMALVATGLTLIGWRLFTGRSAAWLINANALAATLVLSFASVIDLGATAAAWNTRAALTPGTGGSRLDLCYMVRSGPSALVSLATLETRARYPAQRDALASLRWDAQRQVIADQANWRSWTPRGVRRLRDVEQLVGTGRPHLRSAPNGRGCNGSISSPPPLPSPPTVQAAAAAPLTQTPEQ